jgi:hypothetical protein
LLERLAQRHLPPHLPDDGILDGIGKVRPVDRFRLVRVGLTRC